MLVISFLPHGLLHLLSYIIQDYLSGSGPTHSELDKSLINNEKSLKICLRGNFPGYFLSIKIASPRIFLDLHQADKNQPA